MLSPRRYDALADALVSGYQEALVAEVLDALITSLASGGVLNITDQRTLELAMRLNREAVEAALITHSTSISAQARAAVVDTMRHADTVDTAALAALYPGTPPAADLIARQMTQQTADGVARMMSRSNLAMTQRAVAVWHDVATEAMTRASLGAEPLDATIARAVARLCDEGIDTIDYASGRAVNLDVAIRRYAVTQVGQAAGYLTADRLSHYNHDLVQTSAHSGSRPDHAEWQGQVFSFTGTTPGYPDFVSSTGYGAVDGLLGANCRHSYGVWFEGSPLPEQAEEYGGMSSDEHYAATQTQRRHERAIRGTKREIAGLRTAGADDTAARLKLGRQQARLADHVGATGLPRNPLREKAYGIGPQPLALGRQK